MTEHHVRYSHWQPRVQANTGSAFLEAGVLLVVGFFVLTPVDFESVTLRFSSYAVVWTFRIGGLCMLGIGLLCLIPWQRAALVDAIISAAIGLVFVVFGAIWIVHKDLMGALIFLFGLMSLHSARTSLRTYQSVITMADDDGVEGLSASASEGHYSDVAERATPVETPYERRSETPADPIPDGALAELGRQDDPANTASPPFAAQDHAPQKREEENREKD